MPTRELGSANTKAHSLSAVNMAWESQQQQGTPQLAEKIETKEVLLIFS